ncbi:MAG: T9SS type A sorting domain-containing protein, partial [Bacteroidetes bacterium]|nr:T9SS type A sorting domain-containing protein [Bacteroidota bacterium]
FKVRFRAHGASSLDIMHWYLDNIRIYAVCTPPLGLTYTESHNTVNLSWNAPECASDVMLQGYYIYRTDSTGMAPYQLLNIVPVSAASYADILSLTGVGAYRYFVTAAFNDPFTNLFLCESPGADTIAVLFPAVGIAEKADGKIIIWPNPATEEVNIMCNDMITGIEVMNAAGQSVYINRNTWLKALKISVRTLRCGVYFMKVSTTKSIHSIKIAVTR